MARAATSFPNEWRPLFESRVAACRRSESRHLAVLIEQDLRASGLLTDSAQPALTDEISRIHACIMLLPHEQRAAVMAQIDKVVRAALRDKAA